MTGIVLKSTGSWYNILSDGGRVIACRIQGKFRNQNIKSTNPIAVGDRVDIDLELDQETGLISYLHPRNNYIVRKSVNLSKQTHILASNIDILLIVATISQPKTSTGFIDRMLLSANLFNICPIIVFNKIDIYKEQDFKKLALFTDVYREAGYKVLHTSLSDPSALADLKQVLVKNKVLLGGHSGVGKSSLINAIFPNLNLKTAKISEWSAKGTHTTTFAEMFPCEDGAFIIDSPGIKEMGMVDLEPNEICHYIPEFMAVSEQCKFYNCKHINEPNCAVIQAVEQGKIAMFRYANYLGLFHGFDSRK